MAGLFSRLKIWNADEDLSAIDLNNEFNHFLANIDALHSEGFSENLTQMQTQQDPGGLGTENLTQPISQADEDERLRFVIARIIGLPFWYQTPAIDLNQIAQILDAISSLTPSRVVSGKTTTLTIQPNYLMADASSGINIDGLSVNLVYYVDGVEYTLITNATLPALNPAPGTNNTALLTSIFDGLQDSKSKSQFNVGTVGSNIAARSSFLTAFKIVDGGNTEYFIGTPDITGTSGTINGISRGFTFDSTGVNNEAIALTTGETITLLEISYVFLTSTFTLSVTYNPIHYSATPPPAPSAGDYWWDFINQTWKTFSGGNWIKSNAVFVGIALQDSTGSTVATRSADFFEVFEELSTITLDTVTNDSVSLSYVPLGFQVSVYGRTTEALFQDIFITMPTNLIPGETETPNTTYYIYIDRNQNFYFSAIAPLSRPDILGLYHPAEALKAIGQITNDSSSNFIPISLLIYQETLAEQDLATQTEEHSWELNGDYSSLTFPLTDIDSAFMLDYNVKLLSVFIWAEKIGSGGTTEFDLKLRPGPGQSEVSILSTTGKITAEFLFTTITYNTLTGSFSLTETITGGTSGATGVLYQNASGSMVLQTVSGLFLVGETITGSSSGATANVATVINTYSPTFNNVSYSTLVGTFSQGELLTGSTSTAKAHVYFDNGTNLMSVQPLVGTFFASETITGGTSGATATVLTDTVSGSPVWTDSGTVILPIIGVTKPVIQNAFLPAGSALTWDLLQSMTENAGSGVNLVNDARIRIFYTKT